MDSACLPCMRYGVVDGKMSDAWQNLVQKADFLGLGLWFSGNLLASHVKSSWVRSSPEPSSGGGAGWEKGCRSFNPRGPKKLTWFSMVADAAVVVVLNVFGGL